DGAASRTDPDGASGETASPLRLELAGDAPFRPGFVPSRVARASGLCPDALAPSAHRGGFGADPADHRLPHAPFASLAFAGAVAWKAAQSHRLTLSGSGLGPVRDHPVVGPGLHAVYPNRA